MPLSNGESVNVRELISSCDVQAVRVEGDHLRADALTDGDLLFVQRERDPREGDTIIAILEGESAARLVRYSESTQYHEIEAVVLFALRSYDGRRFNQPR